MESSSVGELEMDFAGTRRTAEVIIAEVGVDMRAFRVIE